MSSKSERVESLVHQNAVRRRMHETEDLAGAATFLAQYVEELGFPRCAVFLDHEAGPGLTLACTRGYADLPAGLELAAAAVHPLIAGKEITDRSLVERLRIERPIAFPLRDGEGVLGVVIAGPASAAGDSATLQLTDLLPDTLPVFRHRLLRERWRKDRAMLLAQQAENERLLRELRIRNEEMLDDLEQAREFQSQMLKRAPTVSGISIQTHYRPHEAVSGDLHDITWDGTKLRVFLADTTGHGLRAGLATMLLRAEYESVRRAGDPVAVLTELNARIVATYRGMALTMTALCFDLDPSTGEITLATAAHPSPIVVNGNVAIELPSGGSFIGMGHAPPIVSSTATIGRGDAIYVYTDGITEAASPDGELFGEERACAAVLEGHAQGSGVRSLASAAEAFCRAAGGFSDDVAIVGILRDR